MSWNRSITIGFIVALTTSLLLARAHPFGDAGLYAQARGVPIMQSADIPRDVREILVRKCADCHSTETRMPLYGRFAPFSWLMERDILEAREAMDLTRWNDYSASEKDAFKVKIFLEAKSHRMPLSPYGVIHRNARTTDTDIDSFNRWVHQSRGLAILQVTTVADKGEAIRGRDVFERRCTGCHSLDQNREGPRLRGVYGRMSGSVSDFDYSSAVKKAHIVWSEAMLERWLADPDMLVPGNNMEFRVAKPQERSDLIRFLKESAAQ